MTIVHYEPWRLFNRFHSVFSDGAAASETANSSEITWLPVVDVHEEAERFVVRADLPGVAPKDVEITAEKGVLTVRGQRHADKHENASGYERVERVSDKLKEGDQIRVKVLEVDRQGRIRLSMRNVDAA